MTNKYLALRESRLTYGFLVRRLVRQCWMGHIEAEQVRGPGQLGELRPRTSVRTSARRDAIELTGAGEDRLHDVGVTRRLFRGTAR